MHVILEIVEMSNSRLFGFHVITNIVLGSDELLCNQFCKSVLKKHCRNIDKKLTLQHIKFKQLKALNL